MYTRVKRQLLEPKTDAITYSKRPAVFVHNIYALIDQFESNTSLFGGV